jgi:uncharacterized membrane protein
METFFVTKVSAGFFPSFTGFSPADPHFFCATFIFKPRCMQPPAKGKSTFKKIIRYFIQGLIILAPIGITVYVLYWLFDKVDSILRPYVNIPGLGFAIIILFILLVGWISSSFLMGGFINFFDQWMERTPGIKFIYSSTKDFFEAFAGDKKKFNQAILANAFANDVWVVGFLTDEEMQKFELGADHVAVYVPQSYHWAGQLFILPRQKVKKIDKITSGEAMKYAVTGGVVDLDEERIEEPLRELTDE